MKTVRTAPVTITVSSVDNRSTTLAGFLHLWAMYVRGFNYRQHCQKSFRGRLSQFVRTTETALYTPFTFNEVVHFDSLYLCGVAGGPVSARKLNNLHLALEPSQGATFVHETYNGYLIHVGNAVKLPIPELPDGWNGLPQAYTRCCNFRFCVYRFGYPSLECVTQLRDKKSELKTLQNPILPLAAGF